MKSRILLVAGIIVLLVMLLAANGCSNGVSAADSQPINVNVGNQQTGIWVNGEGKITLTPDLATLTLGVSAQTTTVAEAQSQAATAMDKVMKALTDAGIAKNDIQTRYYNINQVTRWDDKTQQQIVIGYNVSNSVIAKIRAMDKVGSIIDSVAVAGGDLTRINGINFSVEKPEKYYTQVRDLALKDAKTKAQQIADATSVTLGKPTYVSENSSSPVAYPQVSYSSKDAAMGASVPTTSISAGELTVTLNVQVAYAIQ
jgi:uncharacterized protein